MQARVKEPRTLGPGALDLLVEGADVAAVRAAAEAALAGTGVDACAQPWDGRRKRLLVADMDSTIINVECIDELADFAGVKEKVSEITERAMRGELDFEGALRERVGMLKGLPLGDLQRAYDERVRLNAGARTLVRTMSANGGRAVLVSGGFTFFTGRVAALVGFHEHHSNTLLEANGRLTGDVADPILGRNAKLATLKRLAAAEGIGLDATLAVGDGANDIPMLTAAGLGIGYYPHAAAAEAADAVVRHHDLTALLWAQGYPRRSWVLG